MLESRTPTFPRRTRSDDPTRTDSRTEARARCDVGQLSGSKMTLFHAPSDGHVHSVRNANQVIAFQINVNAVPCSQKNGLNHTPTAPVSQNNGTDGDSSFFNSTPAGHEKELRNLSPNIQRDERGREKADAATDQSLRVRFVEGGRRMVEEGRRVVAKGRRVVEDGLCLVDEGCLVEEGWRLVEEGRCLVEEGRCLVEAGRYLVKERQGALCRKSSN